MKTPDQVYKTHIDTSAEKVWEAITNPEFTRQYWFGSGNIAKEWKAGEVWEHRGMETGVLHHMGVVEESAPPHKLVLSWGNPGDEKDISRVTFEIVAKNGGVDLTITHGGFADDSAMAKRVSGGWPKVVANLKEFLEKGCAANNSKPGCAA